MNFHRFLIVGLLTGLLSGLAPGAIQAACHQTSTQCSVANLPSFLPSGPPLTCGPFVSGQPNPGSSAEFDGKLILGTSYFSAIAGWRASDLDWIQLQGHNNVRVMATWNRDWRESNPSSHPIPNSCLINSRTGNIISSAMNELEDFIEAAGSRGLTVDVSFWYRDFHDAPCTSQGTSENCSSNETTCWNKYTEGIVEFVNAIEGRYPHVFVDIANEAVSGYQGGSTTINPSRLNALSSAVKGADPNRLITISQGGVTGGTQPPFTAATQVDFASPHLKRDSGWHSAAETRIAAHRAKLETIQPGWPIYMQEENRIGWTGCSTGNCPATEFMTSLAQSIHAGAAGWVFHTGAAYDLANEGYRSALGSNAGIECTVARCADDMLAVAQADLAANGCFPGSQARQAIRDTFSRSDGNLSGTTTERGTKTWAVGSTAGAATWYLQVANQQVRSATPSHDTWGGVPFTFAGDGSRVLLSADLNPDASDPTDRVGFGFANALGDLDRDGEFWLTLADNGDYRVADRGGLVTSGSAIGFFNPDDLNRVMLSYDPATGFGSAWINQVSVLDETALVVDEGATSQVTMQFDSLGGSASTLRSRVDNLEVCELPTSLKDAFEGSGLLSGRTPAFGDAAWTATPTNGIRLLSRTQNIRPDIVGTDARGALFFDLETSGEVLTVAADIKAKGSDTVTIGLLGKGIWVGDDMALAATVDSVNDRLTVSATDPIVQILHEVQFPSGFFDEFRHIELDYDPISNTAAIRYDGDQGAPRMPLSSPLKTIAAAIDFRGNVSRAARADNFEVRRRSAVARDGFVGSGTLEGHLTEWGGRTWNASDFQLSNGTAVPIASARASLPFPEAMNGDVIEISATLSPTSNGWAGLGLTETSIPAFWNDPASIWIQVRPTGTVKVNAKGTTYDIGSTTVTASTSHFAVLRYDPLANTVEAEIDGVPIPLTTSDLDDLGYQPDIAFGSLHLHGTGAGSYADDFSFGMTCQ